MVADLGGNGSPMYHRPIRRLRPCRRLPLVEQEWQLVRQAPPARHHAMIHGVVRDGIWAQWRTAGQRQRSSKDRNDMCGRSGTYQEGD